MKKKSTSQSAFFNLRVLIGLSVFLAGVFLALLGFGTFSGLTASSAQAQQKPKIIINSSNPLVPNGFDCSKIHELGIDKMENMRAGAIRIACGLEPGGFTSVLETVHQAIQETLAPSAYGGADKNLINPQTDAGTHITQSETYSLANPDNPNQIVVTYNDSRSFPSFNNISGASVSTDGGTTFTRLIAATGRSPFDNTFGDPVTLYNKPTGTWFAIWLDAACGGQGLGGYKSTTPWDPNSWTHFCVHTGSFDDRESGWSDNNPASPFFGRMYVSWNNFADGGSLRVRFSTDNGLTWTNERQLAPASPFIRDVQITGDSANGTVYVAGMNEGGGGTGGPRANKIYRSTDGGNTWTNTFTSVNFTGPSDGTTCSTNSYFATMFAGYWRHMGWGQIAALNGVVHYDYAQRGAGADGGDIFYIRSTDSGATFSAPLKLNTDATTRPQWQPNLSVSPGGTLFAAWYDARESTNCIKGNPAVPCYRMWGRKSTDNGVTWLANDMVSDVVTPLPAQPDPNIVACYVGDYDYGSATADNHVTAWVDGRVSINNQSQQDSFFDKEPAGGGGGGIPCGDLVSFQARCRSNGRLEARLTLTDTSHSGEQVTITVDGNPNSVTINGNRALLRLNNTPLGQHTVELTDPAGCFPPVVTSCN